MAASAAGAVLDKSLLKKVLPLIALSVPARECTSLRKVLQGAMLKKPRVRPIIPDPSNEERRLILLNDEVVTTLDLEGLPDDAKTALESVGAEPTSYDLVLDYDYWRTDELLAQILPEGVDAVHHFETVGHIAHLNLREEQLPYKHLIAQVLLDKNSSLRTVVNKCASISNEFRVFPMEILAGDDDMITEVKESQCRFQLDYSKVYWNSRLGTEHWRLVSALRRDDVICDMMAGVGPFAVPAAKKGCEVHANDLNPESYKWLVHNAKLNKVTDKLKTYNMDGRDFVRQLIADGVEFTQVIMNLPACAELFCDVFVAAFPPGSVLPTINCYCFSKEDDPVADAIKRLEEVVGGKLERIHVHDVRDVAPKKRMLCATFPLPPEIGYSSSSVVAGVKRAREDSTSERGGASESGGSSGDTPAAPAGATATEEVGGGGDGGGGDGGDGDSNGTEEPKAKRAKPNSAS